MQGFSNSNQNNGYQKAFEQQEQNNNNPNFFPPLLLDALGGGRRPGKLSHSPNHNNLFQNQSISLQGQSVGGVTTTPYHNSIAGNISPGTSNLNHHRSRSQRSRSRERSLTPGIFGSPSSTNHSNQINDIDAPPTMMLMDSIPSATGIQVSGQFKPPPLKTSDYSNHNQFQDDSPGSAMSVDAKSSIGGTPTHRNFIESGPTSLKSPSTPASLANNGSTVTFIGFPSNKRTFVLDLAASQCGPIYHIKNPEKSDSNWLIVTFLNSQSAERALRLDGTPQEGAWVLCVKRGDTIGALSSNIKSKPKMESPQLGSHRLDDSLMVESPLLQMKNNKKILLSPFKSDHLESYKVTERARNQTSTPKLYPSLSDTVYSPNLATYSPYSNLEDTKTNLNGSKNETDGAIAKPASLLTKIADFLFGW